MKKIILSAIILFSALSQVSAQNTINFTGVYPDQDNLSTDAKEKLKLKVEQIIARNNAGATSVYNAFIIQPTLEVQETKATEGLVRNVTLVTGELTLTAKNLYDESIYGTVVMSLEGDATGNQETALNALIRNIKITNPVFTRFIRTTRQKIEEHYINNCQTIITKAQTMVSMDRVDDAIGYLSSVPEITPCYEEAASMLTLAYTHAKTLECDQRLLMARSKYVMRNYEEALEILAEIPSTSTCSEGARALTDSIEKYIGRVEVVEVESIVEVEKPVEVIVERVVERPIAEQEVVPSDEQYRLNVSCPDLDFDLISCTGDVSSKTITLYCRMVNKGKAVPQAYIRANTAIDTNGSTYERLGQSTMHGCSDSTYSNNMPTDVPVSKCFVIYDLTRKIDKLSYVEINARSCKIELRDVPVTWK